MKFTKAERGWIMYDWANSAFSAIIAAIILPSFYDTLTQGNLMAQTWWGYATSIGALVCAVLAPFLGTLGDYRGMKKKLFTVFVILGVVATGALGFTDKWQSIILLYILGTIGFNGSCVFYDGFLADVTTKERMDRVSSFGYGLGYIGGSTIPLIMGTVLIMMPEKFGINATQACQVSFLITAVWWLVFTVPFWKNVHQVNSIEPTDNLAKQTVSRLGEVSKKIAKDKNLLYFLLAYFFYIDGVGTIIHMATIFGKNMGMGNTEMIIILMVVQLVAFPCAIAYGNLAKKVGTRRMIMVGIITYMFVCFTALTLEPLGRLGHGPLMGGFILLAVLVGTAQGGIQALSRSFYGKMIPPETANEYFGFFDIFGKFSAVIGPALFSFVWGLTKEVYLGIVPVLLMFIVGAVLFAKVPAEK